MRRGGVGWWTAKGGKGDEGEGCSRLTSVGISLGKPLRPLVEPAAAAVMAGSDGEPEDDSEEEEDEDVRCCDSPPHSVVRCNSNRG